MRHPGFVLAAGIFFSAALWALGFGLTKLAMLLAACLFLSLIYAV